jgi:hypothetical protein
MDNKILPCKCNEVYINRVDDSPKGCYTDSRFANKVFGENRVVIDGRCDLAGQNCCLGGCTHKCNLRKNSHMKECQTTHSSLNLFNYPNTIDANKYKVNNKRVRCWKSFEETRGQQLEKEYNGFLKAVYGEEKGNYIEVDGYMDKPSLYPSCYNK